MRAATRERETTWVSLTDIRISERRARRLSAPTVERYREWLEQGRVAPLVRLARQGDAFIVRDGRHRVLAALAACYTLIEAEVRTIGRLLRRLYRFIGSGGTRRRSGRFGDALRERLSLAPIRTWVRLPPSPLPNADQGQLSAWMATRPDRSGSVCCGSSCQIHHSYGGVCG